jgi:hypothetical protein
MCWATFWAIFSQTHLVTLVIFHPHIHTKKTKQSLFLPCAAQYALTGPRWNRRNQQCCHYEYDEAISNDTSCSLKHQLLWTLFVHKKSTNSCWRRKPKIRVPRSIKTVGTALHTLEKNPGHSTNVFYYFSEERIACYTSIFSVEKKTL